MVLFFNESSLSEFADWREALSVCRGAIAEVREARVACAMHRDREYFWTPGFLQRFNNLPLPSDERAILRDIVFSERLYPCWRPGRCSDAGHLYECADPAMIFVDDTVAEAAERCTGEAAPVIVLSARNSVFDGRELITIRRDALIMEPIVVTSVEGVRRRLAALPGQYDPNSTSAPRDFQTILGKDPVRFAFTGKMERRLDRRVHIERNTGRYFYVDEGHPGMTAHLEVFSPVFLHVGTADIHTGAVDETRQDPNKRLRF